MVEQPRHRGGIGGQADEFVITLAALDLRYRQALWTGLDAHRSLLLNPSPPDALTHRSRSRAVPLSAVRERIISPNRRGRRFQPARGVAVDERGDRLADPRLVGIEPGDLVVLEQVSRDEGAVKRRQRHRLEAQ